MAIKNKVQLITYADSLGGGLKALNSLLTTHFVGIFLGGVHILPPFPSSADRGFAPLTYFEVAPSFGTWEDIRQIGERFDVLIDLMVNHISRQSPYFQDFTNYGRESKYADFFLTIDKVWPDGNPSPEDVKKIFLRKPDHPFSDIEIQSSHQIVKVWTSFGSRDWSEQIDLDVHSAATRQFFTDVLKHFSRNGVSTVRLDAVGYVIKKPGTSCFFVEPDIYDFLEWIAKEAAAVGIDILPEVHAHYAIQFKLAEHGYWAYDFVLPALILHTLLRRSSYKLQRYLKICPRRQFTQLDCHDGIPIQPDVDDILDLDDAQTIVQICLDRGANLNRILSAEHKRRDDFDVHQINCTYYSALNCDDDAYIAARSIQFFSPGIPQVYYVGLLAGENDYEAVRRQGEGRAINRHNFSVGEVDQALDKPVVQRLLKLIQFRNQHPAFEGTLEVSPTDDSHLALSWKKGHFQCSLNVDLTDFSTEISYRNDHHQMTTFRP